MAPTRAALVDLYVPAHLAAPDELCARAAEAGLDAIVLACEASDEPPDRATRAALTARHGVAVHLGRVVAPDESFRLLLLGADDVASDLLTAIEGLGDPERVRAAVRELGERSPAAFACCRVGLRARPEFGAAPDPVPLTEADGPGVVALLAGASRLARDLDCEALGERHIPVLGASGPFAQLADIGRHATALPAAPADAAGLARQLRAGAGFAVELLPPDGRAPSATGRATGAPSPSPADPSEGRDESAEGRKRPRRRRRGGRKADAAPT
jgi:hypothetical protein